jgi:hypothetical protein
MPLLLLLLLLLLPCCSMLAPLPGDVLRWRQLGDAASRGLLPCCLIKYLLRFVCLRIVTFHILSY